MTSFRVDARSDWQSLPFDEAIEYFRSKVNLPTASYRDLTAQQQDRAFAVAGVMQAELLESLRQAVDKALVQGTTLQEFRQDFDREVAAAGWSYRGNRTWRTELILNQNLRQAYGAGRYGQLTDPATLKARPYWMWRHGDSIYPRKQHLAWDGTTLPANHPWFRNKFPPAGFGCKCKILSLDKAAKVSKVPDDEFYEYTDAQGRRVRVPVGVDAGFEVIPGAENLTAEVERQTAKLPLLSQLAVWDKVPGNIARPLRYVSRAWVISTLQTAVQAALNFDRLSPDPKVAIAQLIEMKVFNFGLSLATGWAFDDYGLAGDAAQIAFSGALVTSAGKAVQREFHKQGAKEIINIFGEDSIDQIKRALANPKTTQRTYVISGLGDEFGEGAQKMAQNLRALGLKGEIVPINNPSKQVKNLWDTILYQTFLNHGRSTQSVAQQIIADFLVNGEVSKINLVGYSSGANISEGVAGIFKELGIEIDDIVTWGGVGSPPQLGKSTRYRRYFSNKDYLQFLRIPDPNRLDRFFEDVYHGGMGERPGQLTWPQRRDVVQATVDDLNEFLKQVDDTPSTGSRRKPPTPPDGIIDVDFAPKPPEPPPGPASLLSLPPGVKGGPLAKRDPPGEIVRIRNEVGGVTQAELDSPIDPKEIDRIIANLERAKQNPGVFAGDLNILTATNQELLTLTPLNTRQVASLRKFLAEGGQINSLDDLLKVPDIGPKTVEKLKALAEIAEIIDINSASVEDLQKNLNISKSVATKIYQEAQRQPFVNPADVQRRVKGVGAKTVEKLTKQVMFGRSKDNFIQGLAEELKNLQDFSAKREDLDG